MPIYRAKTYFLIPGRPPRRFSVGDLVDSTDPAVKGRESLFEPVETATAAPGERRSSPRRSTKKTPPKGD